MSTSVVRSMGRPLHDDLPAPSVSGHGARVDVVRVDAKEVLAFRGRLHAYEGISAAHVCLPTLACAYAGCTHVIYMNAAGGSVAKAECG